MHTTTTTTFSSPANVLFFMFIGHPLFRWPRRVKLKDDLVILLLDFFSMCLIHILFLAHNRPISSYPDIFHGSWLLIVSFQLTLEESSSTVIGEHLYFVSSRVLSSNLFLVFARCTVCFWRQLRNSWVYSLKSHQTVGFLPWNTASMQSLGTVSFYCLWYKSHDLLLLT